MSPTMTCAVARLLLTPFLLLSAPAIVAFGQNPPSESGVVSNVERHVPGLPKQPDVGGASPGLSATSLYFDPLQGSSSSDLVQRALSSNPEISAVRLDIHRGRARLRQAGLRANPTIDFEQTTGRFTGSTGERETSIGFALPLELGGKRQRRIDLARVELEAAEAEVADRERRLIADVRTAYAEAMAALRELEITENLNNLDIQTARIVEARVTEGESSPLESNLLRVEVDRLKARRALVEGRLQAAMLRLKMLAGIPASESLRLGEDLVAPGLPEPPSTVEAAVDIALRTRLGLRRRRQRQDSASHARRRLPM